MEKFENNPELQRVACELAKHPDGLRFDDLREKAGVAMIHRAVDLLNGQGFEIGIVYHMGNYRYRLFSGPGFVIDDQIDLGTMVRNYYLKAAVGGMS